MSDAKVKALEVALRAALKTACDQGLVLSELRDGTIGNLQVYRMNEKSLIDMAVHEIEIATSALMQ